MRRLMLLAVAACGTDPKPTGGASLVLDIPGGMLDPKGYSTVVVTLHEASGDSVRSAKIGPNNQFDFGDIDPRKGVSIEAALRNDSGAAVGYGRTPVPVDLEADAQVTIQVRRPIAYIAGVSLTAPNVWVGVPATFSDLSTGTILDGTTTVGNKPVLMVSAGSQLYSVDQSPMSPSGVLTGPATIRQISTGDHTMAAQLPGMMTGAVQDGAGSDDGSTLIIGTSEKLFSVDTAPGAATPVREIATGNFARVAIVAGTDGSLNAVAIENRVTTTGTCNSTAKLWWIGNLGAVGEVVDARVVAMGGGFADVASDGGRAFYVDACKGELGEVLSTGPKSLRNNLGRPTAIAVSNGQAFVGVEKPALPAAVALLVMPVGASDMPRTLWSEAQQQVLRAPDFPGVQRQLDANTAVFTALEIGAGGDYVAASVSGQFHGNAVAAANFPVMDIVTEELRVFDAASGGTVQRYRSWCDGSYAPGPFDIDNWACATTTGQSEPRMASLDHRVTSMTFLFGKK